METRNFGNTGLTVSALGFGGGPVGLLAIDRAEATAMLNATLDGGITLIDTAAAYQGSEAAIGEAIGHRRDEYVLVSKCGQAFDDIAGDAWSARCVGQTVDRALRRLKTDRLDVMLLHTCDLEVLQRGEAVGALAAARDAGKIRFAGYSGDNEAAVYAAGLEDIAVIETSVNICDQANIDGLLPLALARGIGVLAKRPIANAAWRSPADQPGMYANYAQTYHERLGQMGVTPADLGFSGEVATQWPEVALRFTLAQAGVSSAIVGTTRAARVSGNIAVADKGALPADAVAALRAAFVKAEAAAGEAWPGMR